LEALLARLLWVLVTVGVWQMQMLCRRMHKQQQQQRQQ
jgi:hypothetical protein